MNMTSDKSKKILVIAVLVAVCAIFCVRLINIDQDIAPWGVSMYQPADEGPYAYLAINEKAYGTIRPTVVYDGKEIPLLISENFITNVLGNLLNIVGFHVFGNNYYALRVPYVLIGAVNLVLFGLLLQKLRRRYGGGRMSALVAQLALILWMALDFTYFNASRIVEPTAVRMLFVQLTALIFISYPKSDRARFFVVGLLITFSTFMVYITNIFLYLAVGLYLLFNLRRDGAVAFFKRLIWFILGSAIMFVAAEAYYKLVWGTEAVTNALKTIMSFSSNSSAELTINSEKSIPVTLLLLLSKMLSSNPFVYNLPVLFGGTIAAIPLVRMIRRKKDGELSFFVLIVVSFFLQTLFSSDTISRKMIVIFPVFVGLLYTVLITKEPLRVLPFRRKKPKDGETVSRGGRIAANVLNVVIWGLATMNVLVAFAYRVQFYDWTCGDFDLVTKLLLLGFEVLPLLLVVLFIAVCAVGDQSLVEQLSANRLKLAGALLACMCLLNVSLCFKYYWKDPQFSERDAMIDISDMVDGEYVLGGGFQLGFALYNDMKPVVNTPEMVMKIARDIPDALFLDYSDLNGNLMAYFNSTYYIHSNGTQFFMPVWELNRMYETFGYAHNMCLYKVANAEEYQQYRLRMQTEAKDSLMLNYNTLSTGMTGMDGDEYSAAYASFQRAQTYYIYWLYPLSHGAGYPKNGSVVSDICDNIRANIDTPIYGNVYGTIFGDINAPIYGDICGDIYGDVNVPLQGNVYGSVYGRLNADISGNVYGVVDIQSGAGSVLGNVYEIRSNKASRTATAQSGTVDYAALAKDIRIPETKSNFLYSYQPNASDVDADIIKDVLFEIYGNVNGNVYGNVNADIYGDVKGNIYGDVNAIIYGSVKGCVYGRINREGGADVYGGVDSQAVYE